MHKNLPTISVIIPAYNEQFNLTRLFKSLSRLTYPKSKIEYIVVDDDSNDNTYKLSKEFGAKVIRVKTHDVELNKGIGLYATKNDFVYWMDADMEVLSRDYFQLLVKPMMEDKKIIASFTKEFALDYGAPVKNSFLRFISYHPLQQDPTYKFFNNSLENTIIEERKDYSICKFVPTKIPAVGRILYRKKALLKTDVGKNRSFVDLESVEIVARAGHQLFAYVPKAKIRHYHCDSLIHLVKKRPLRNLGYSFLGDQSGDYLPNVDKKYYLWFNSRDKKDAFKVIFWVIYANLFIPELIRGIARSIKHRDYAFLWHPLTAIAITDAVIYGFMARPEGRRIAVRVIKTLLGAKTD